MLSYQPSAPGFDLQLGSECVMQYAGNWKEMHEAIFFLLQNLALQLGLGQGCQPEGIAITWQQLFSLQKRHTVTLECGSLHKFCMTSSSLEWKMKWNMEWNGKWNGMEKLHSCSATNPPHPGSICNWVVNV